MAQAADGSRGTRVGCQTVPRGDWSALCHGSYWALLSSRLAELLLVGIASEEHDAHKSLDAHEEGE